MSSTSAQMMNWGQRKMDLMVRASSLCANAVCQVITWCLVGNPKNKFLRFRCVNHNILLRMKDIIIFSSCFEKMQEKT